MQNPRRRNPDRLLFLPLFPLSSLSITVLVVLLAVGPQSVQGRTRVYENYVCTIRDLDDALLSCTVVAGTGSGSTRL